MPYNGDVVVGGKSQCRKTSQLEIHKLAVGPLSNNVYLLVDRITGSSLLIDAAAEPERILALCGEKLNQLLTTHGHWDHQQALPEIVEATSASTLASAGTAALLSVPTDTRLNNGDLVAVGTVMLEAITLYGHGNDHDLQPMESIGLIHRDIDGSTHIFAGDCLFPGGLGKTANRNSFNSLYRDVTEKIFHRLPDDSYFYPGHGPDSTLGAERPSLEDWFDRGW